MHIDTTKQLEPRVLTIQRMLRKIDRLRLPPASRWDLEHILVRQVARELDRLFPWQAGHGQDTATVAVRIGQAMQLDDEALHHLNLAALLHDIGLVMLPPHLQTRQGFYDAGSYVTVQNHPRLGAALLAPFQFLREASVMIAHHHEHWDGSGYPYGLRGSFIPFGARILAVADVFESVRVPGLTERSRRDYVALRILQVASGTQFDPSVIETLRRLMEAPDRSRNTHDNTVRGEPASAQRRLQSGTPTAPTTQAGAFASRWPQPPLLNTAGSCDRPDNPVGSVQVQRMGACGESSVEDDCPLQPPHIQCPLQGWDLP